MEIGKPRRTVRVEPLEVPVPRKLPQEQPQPKPDRRPLQPDKVPA